MPPDIRDPEYVYRSSTPTYDGEYLWSPVLSTVRASLGTSGRIFELGCGNGAASNMLSALGYDVTAVDPSVSGIDMAKASGSHARFAVGSAYDDLAALYGRFPVVLSLEVVEHCFWPRRFAQTVFDLIEPGGTAIISTPFHGYLKNLTLALLGKFDAHWNPLWDGGHIKFWSENTLRELLMEAGFSAVAFQRAGRIPPLAKSMIAVAKKPGVSAST